ncbi:MAG: FG-GAP-like repeat-containing protein, partial [Flavobacteriales bacterium]
MRKTDSLDLFLRSYSAQIGAKAELSRFLNPKNWVRCALMTFSVLFFPNVQAQETNCGDGLDNDGNGYVDCYDSNCSGSSACEFVNQPTPPCQFVPAPATFKMQKIWSTSVSMDARQTPVVGDLDGDGIPEVIAKQYNQNNGLFVFNGATGALKTTINSPKSELFSDAVAIADVDGDGMAEIFFVSDGGLAAADSRYLYCYNNDGTLKWKSNAQVGYVANDDQMSPQLADFNQDGIPEVFCGNKIFNARTGVLLAQGGSTRNSGGHVASINEGFPVAVDILPNSACPTCQGLELVVGDEILAVDLSNAVPTAAITLAKSFPYAANHVQRNGFTSVADMDGDGDLDVVVINRGDGTYGNRAVCYIWDGQTTALLGGPFQLDQCSAGVPLQGGTAATTVGGHANIADFNGDGTLEIGLAGKFYYLVMDYNKTTHALTELWSKKSTDGSERTGSSVFDFEGDGANEVVYRDEDSLYVYNGADGAIKASVYCTSPTRTEYPLVADVTGNGETNICVTCGVGVSLFGAVTTPWVTARRVWNQHNYFVVNVNDDLTIPRVQQDHAKGYPAAAPVNFPFNSFLTQITRLGMDGLPIYAAQDIAIDAISVDSANCGVTGTLNVTLTLHNKGDHTYPTGSPLSFYIGDPTTTAAPYVGLYSTTSAIGAGNTSIQYFAVPSTCFNGFLFAVANDNGSILPPFASPGNSYAECDYANNVKGTAFVCAGTFSFTCPGNVNANPGPGGCTANVTVPAPTASSTCGAPNIINDFNGTANASGTYPAGITTLHWTITDATGTIKTCTQTVTVTDNIDPIISCPATVNTTTNTGCTATGVALGTPTFSDNCGTPTVTNNAPSVFPLGTTTVTWTVTDAANNTATCTQTVTVTDNVNPTITCPVDVTANTNSGCTATGVVLGTPVTADNCGVATVTNNAPVAFPIGVTNVTWTVTDNSGNTATCIQKVTVSDNMNPTITCPADVTANTNSGCTATGV